MFLAAERFFSVFLFQGLIEHGRDHAQSLLVADLGHQVDDLLLFLAQVAWLGGQYTGFFEN